MVAGHGMDDALGPRVMLDDENASEQMSQARRARVDDAIDALLAAERTRAADVLAAHRAQLDALVVVLLLDKRVLEAGDWANLVPAAT
jgi:ATP-dependent Zn protease